MIRRTEKGITNTNRKPQIDKAQIKEDIVAEKKKRKDTETAHAGAGAGCQKKKF